MYEKIKPSVFYVNPQMVFSPYVKIQSSNPKETIAFVQKVYNEFYPGSPIYTSFLEDDIAHAYQEESKVVDIFKLASILSIIIACLGFSF